MRCRGLDLAARYARVGRARGEHRLDPLTHALQCAALATRATSDAEIILAALLHDVGHLLLGTPTSLPERPDQHHGRAGAMLIRPFTSARVAWLVEHHVDGRLRFGDDAEPRLAPEPHSWLGDAVRIRQWDHEGKDPDRRPAPLIAYRELLETPFGPQSWSDCAGIGT